MTFKPYPEYKESGVEWLGAVPKSWPIGRIKDSVLIAKNGVWGDEPTGGNDDVWCVRVADFDRPNLSVSDSERTIRSVPASDRLGRELQRGNLLLEKSGGGEKSPVGFVALFDHSDNAVCSNFVARVELGKDMVPKYWAYLHATTYAVRLTQRSIKQTSGIQNLDQSSYFNELTVYPPHAEQRQIADYLDAQTAKIDALIGKQERLIETLAERRQAVISHAVTKGLDPNAAMKDSGHEWLGSIPATWPLKRMSWLFGLIGSGTTPTSDSERYYGEGTPWVTTGELREGTIVATTKSVTDEALHAFPALRVYGPGTLLMAMYGATIGRLAVLGTRACTNQACCALTLPRGIATRFAFYALLAAREHILVLAVGGGQPNINQDIIRGLRLAIPGLNEQQAIVEHLDRETSQIDALSAKAREMIDVLKERRQALISAAVTGKIDVRGLA